MKTMQAHPLKRMWNWCNNRVPRTFFEALKRVCGVGQVSTGDRAVAGDHALWPLAVIMSTVWTWTVVTTTFREKTDKWRWLIIEDLFVVPRVSVSVAVTWMIRKEHEGRAAWLLVAALAGVFVYFILRRVWGPHKSSEGAVDVLFIIKKRIVGVSVAGPFYRWILAGNTDFRAICLWSTGIWVFLIALSAFNIYRKDGEGWKLSLRKMLLEDIATPVHVAFSTPTVEWVTHGHEPVWLALMGVSVVCIFFYWAFKVKLEGWPAGANPQPA
jgi:hypothetical protein